MHEDEIHGGVTALGHVDVTEGLFAFEHANLGLLDSCVLVNCSLDVELCRVHRRKSGLAYGGGFNYR